MEVKMIYIDEGIISVRVKFDFQDYKMQHFFIYPKIVLKDLDTDSQDYGLNTIPYKLLKKLVKENEEFYILDSNIKWGESKSKGKCLSHTIHFKSIQSNISFSISSAMLYEYVELLNFNLHLNLSSDNVRNLERINTIIQNINLPQ